jgi:hypothetical protein
MSEKSVSHSEVAENPMKYTVPQFERRHEDVDSGSKIGGRKPRDVKESPVAERHVQGEPGFTGAERRHASVVANRKETERTFDSRRKGSSSV